MGEVLVEFGVDLLLFCEVGGGEFELLLGAGELFLPRFTGGFLFGGLLLEIVEPVAEACAHQYEQENGNFHKAKTLLILWGFGKSAF